MSEAIFGLVVAAGLGVEVNEAECARHPFAAEVIHTRNAVLDDGSVVDW